MKLQQGLATSLLLSGALLASPTSHAHGDEVYADFPVTVKGYTGDKSSSVSYSGQIARHVLHNSLKKLAGKGNGEANPELEAQILSYLKGSEADLPIIDPATKGQFAVKQSSVNEISEGKNLSGKAYQGEIAGWPGYMIGPEVLEFMSKKAAATEGGYDPLTGYDYSQLISKFTMGAVFYHQIVDNYLDEKLEADNKPNDKPYKEGAYYTGKEHVWDEAWGYFGAPAHALSIEPKDLYSITKQTDEAFKIADANGDGVVDLKTEMSYALAYYAAGADKTGKTDYLHTITEAFIDGRQLIADAKGEALSKKERKKLKKYAATISKNLEQVLAEATFKYAGSVYKDLQKLKATVESNGDASAIFRTYAKHWGELKGFSMALQAGKKDLGKTAVQLNRMIGFSPVLLGNTQVSDIGAGGQYTQETSETLEEYMLHMLKIQKLVANKFKIKARENDSLDGMKKLAKKLSSSGSSAEND